MNDTSDMSGCMDKGQKITTVVAFGEIYSQNVGDGIIFECLRQGLAERGLTVLPADLSRRDGYSTRHGCIPPDSVGISRQIARYFVRRSLFIRRMITIAKWILGGRANFIKKYKDAVGRSDGVIIGGGQILVDRQLYFPLAIQAILKMARNAGKPVAVFSCGADTKQGWIARYIFRRMAREAAYLCVRDAISAEMFQNLDNRLKIDVRPDIAFLSGKFYPQAEVACKKILGINLMPYDTVAAFSGGVRNTSRAEYTAFWRDLIRRATFQGWTVNILTNGDAADLAAAKEVHEACGEGERIFLVASPASPSELVDMLQEIDVIIASRMHAGIVAYSLGKKVTPLIWDSKVSSVWEEADVNVNPISFDSLFYDDRSIESILEYMLVGADIDPACQARAKKMVGIRISESLDCLAACFVPNGLNQDLSAVIS